jgi:hypothetical protein
VDHQTYDCAEQHLRHIELERLPAARAATHLAYLLRWLIERNLVSESFLRTESLGRCQGRESTIFDLLTSWQSALTSEMLSEEGNAFIGRYVNTRLYRRDYEAVLQGGLPSMYHVAYTEQGYHELAERLDMRLVAWREAKQQK